MHALYRIGQVAVSEIAGAIRSRRALVILLLYLLASVFSMNGTITILGKVEHELVEVLQLPPSDETGVVSVTLWKSKIFQKMVRKAVNDDVVYADLEGRHPAELVYGWFAFLFTPLLVVLVAGNRISDDLRSGAIRYQIIRTTRGEWSIGKLLGQVGMIGLAVVFSALGAWAVVLYRLSGVGVFELLPALFGWSLRAWIYSWAWLGLILGLSHLTRSGARATAMGILAIGLLTALPFVLKHFATTEGWRAFLPMLDVFAPATILDSLWRQSGLPLAFAAAKSIILGSFFYSIALAFYLRRDI